MANTDRPNGFKASKTLNGSPVAHMLRKLTVAARADSGGTPDHGDIYIGDPVAMTLAGVVTVADSGDVIYGVVAGVGTGTDIDHGPSGMYTASNLETRYLPDTTAGFVWVYPKENILFEIQTSTDQDLTVGEQSDITNTAATGHGSQGTGQSICELVDGANNDVTVVELIDSPDNDLTLANARVLVSIN